MGWWAGRGGGGGGGGGVLELLVFFWVEWLVGWLVGEMVVGGFVALLRVSGGEAGCRDGGVLIGER